MSGNDWIVIFVAGVALVVAIYSVYAASQHGTPVTLAGSVEALKEAVPVAVQAKEIVQIAVNSAEQLKREGSLKTNDQAFNHALDLAKKWIPPEWQVSNEDIINFINAAVLVSSALARQAGASSGHGTTGSATGQP